MSALAHKRVVITRAPHQAAELEQLLLDRGAVPLLYPCIDIAPPLHDAPLVSALRAALNGDFDWLVLTSANTVLALEHQLKKMGLAAHALSAMQVAAVGSATARSASEHLGLTVSLIPENFTADALASLLQAVQNKRVLLPQSALAEPALAATLTGLGAAVTAVEAYRTVVGSGGVNLPELLAADAIDVITFTSPSTIDNLLYRLEIEGGDISLLTRLCLACIGTKTASAARSHSLLVTVLPTEHTMPGLVNALEQYYAELLIGESE